MSPAKSDALLGDGDFLSIDQALEPLKPVLCTCHNPSKMSPNESFLHSLDLLNISFPREESLLRFEQLINYTFFKNYIFD